MTAKDDWAKAERAAEHWLRALGCVATRRAVRVRFQQVDFFGCDVIGRHAEGGTLWVQVTCGDSSAVAARRRKIEAFQWSPSDGVYLLEMRSKTEGRRITYWFRVHYYERGAWHVAESMKAIPREWFKSCKEKS
jgi:hypothetical protein